MPFEVLAEALNTILNLIVFLSDLLVSTAWSFYNAIPEGKGKEEEKSLLAERTPGEADRTATIQWSAEREGKVR
ncbi:hypothetical protein NPIL_92501 [Nephila pilipes]|uniref:Uncharacterized protein n=1 Tax=Nephila pilipes TaxID=299642 RepID=A0A8X6PA90_NEPPI|nr:hypothetical protein NPIL_92501 [Nephila pilipes]